MTTDKFFALLKQKMAAERPFEVWGKFPRFGEGGGTVKTNCLPRPSEKICPKGMLLRTIPYICHGRADGVRVNFFWPV